MSAIYAIYVQRSTYELKKIKFKLYSSSYRLGVASWRCPQPQLTQTQTKQARLHRSRAERLPLDDHLGCMYV